MKKILQQWLASLKLRQPIPVITLPSPAADRLKFQREYSIANIVELFLAQSVHVQAVGIFPTQPLDKIQAGVAHKNPVVIHGFKVDSKLPHADLAKIGICVQIGEHKHIFPCSAFDRDAVRYTPYTIYDEDCEPQAALLQTIESPHLDIPLIKEREARFEISLIGLDEYLQSPIVGEITITMHAFESRSVS